MTTKLTEIEALRGLDRDELIAKAAEFGIVVDRRDLRSIRWPGGLDSVRLEIIEKMIKQLRPHIEGAIEDLEEEARMHFLRGDQIGERQEGRRSEVEAAHRIAKRLQQRAEQLRKVIPNAQETT